MALLIHLNGAPGVGKSTIAQRYVAEHPGVLDCDVDRLRCQVGGWRDDFAATGPLIRPVALAMIRAHLDGGHDVVLPQLLANEAERGRFREAAHTSGHRYLHLLVQAPPGQAASRFYARPADDPLHEVIRVLVDREGGAEAIGELDRRLAATVALSADTVVLAAEADVDATYESVLAAVRAFAADSAR